jgi:hypothetical protein
MQAMISTSPIIIVSLNTQKIGMYDCTTSGNNVAGTRLVGLDTAKKWVTIITLTVGVDTFHVGKRNRWWKLHSSK